MAAAGSQRIDKWLFFARVVKSRSLAAKLVQTGGVRVNSSKIDQPAHLVKTGDGVTISLERRVQRGGGAVRGLQFDPVGVHGGPQPGVAFAEAADPTG